jgi:hypothetical protein
MERISRHVSVGKGGIARIPYGIGLTHRDGRPQKITPEVISFIETHELADARKGDVEMARMVTHLCHVEEAPICRRRCARCGRSCGSSIDHRCGCRTSNRNGKQLG